MHRKAVLIFLIVLGISSIIACIRVPIAKATWVEGHITQDITWKIEDSPFIVINELTVDANATLTIEPGVEVRFGGNFTLEVKGNLFATGNATCMVTFTSNSLTPLAGDWKKILFSGDKSKSFLIDYARICYSTYGVAIASQGGAMVSNTEIVSNNYGLYIYQGYVALNATFRNNKIANNIWGTYISGVAISGVVLLNNEIFGNMHDGITVDLLASRYGTPSENITIVKNTIYDNSRDGIRVSARSIWGAYVRDINITGNRIFNNGMDGISLISLGECGYDAPDQVYRAGHAEIYNVSISDNIVSSQANGLHLLALSKYAILGGSGYLGYASIHDITVSQNSFSSCINGTTMQKYTEYAAYPNGFVKATLLNNSISYNQYGIFYDGCNGYRTISGDAHFSDVCRNTYGVNVTKSVYINATYCFWGDSSGPYHPTLNPTGKGNSAGGDGTNLLFIPFLSASSGHINERPVAFLNVSKANPIINETVTFDASRSTDDGRIDYYFFDFGDGTNSGWTPLSVVTHKYSAEGTYNATLVVMDDFGVTSLDARVRVVVTIPGDINGDFKVDHKDLLLLASAYGSEDGDPGYIPDADIDCSGKVDHKDLLILAANYGKET